MNISEAKKLVIQAGKELSSSGLIERTWGNVSCRVSKDVFVITPSGRGYQTLTEDEIVSVNAKTLAYEGGVAPSSELRVHAAVYRMREDSRFIIHTHQEKASVLSAAGFSSIPAPQPFTPELGEIIPCASYAPPGTEELSRNTADALGKTAGRAVIMSRHGALCAGASYEEAFSAAAALEKVCGDRLDLLLAGASAAPPPLENSIAFCRCRREIGASGFTFTAEDGEIPVPQGAVPPGYEWECAVCRQIFCDHPEIRFLEAPGGEAIRFALKRGVLQTWLDDFAQIIGPRLETSSPGPDAVSRSLDGVSAVLIRGRGALCCGQTELDAFAARRILEKNCKAFQAASLVSGSLPIPMREAEAMRENYLNSYSRQL